MKQKKVIASRLPLRSSPTTEEDNIIETLNQGQHLEVIKEWTKVRVTMDDQSNVEGYCASQFLGEIHDELDPNQLKGIRVNPLTAAAQCSCQIPPANLRKDNRHSTIDNDRSRAYPLYLEEDGIVTRDCKNRQTKVDSIHQIINYLDVKKSARYQPEKNATYCNIYAYDYAYLCGVYLPRVWWTNSAIKKIKNGETVVVKYGKTVKEQTANDLYDWFQEYGTCFNWKELHDIEEVQKKADEGAVCIITAKVKSGHGHICAVVPQGDGHSAKGQGNNFKPLMSQAGRNNHKFFNSRWWMNKKYNYGFFVHE